MLFHDANGTTLRGHVQFGLNAVAEDNLFWDLAATTAAGSDFKPDTEWLESYIKLGLSFENELETVDGKGVPFAGGGISAGLRDLGRLGLLMLNGGAINGQRLFPSAVVDRISAGGDPSKFAGFPTIPGGSHTSEWWVFHNDNGAFAARGVYGQTVYVDPTARMVLVRLSSFPQAQNGFIDPTSLPAYQAVADYLMAQD